MKKIFLLLIAAVIFSTASFSQSDRFAPGMGATLREMAAANDADAMAAVAAKFERIGDAEKTQWLPYYYAALVKARMSMAGFGGDKDKVADEAQTLLDKAMAIEKNSENYCVVYMIVTAKLLVDPAGRYMQYMGPMNEALESAKKADPTNPRPFMLQAMGAKNTPEQFGGGCVAAKPLAVKAVALYDSFKPASLLHPNWGKEQVDGIITDCK